MLQKNKADLKDAGPSAPGGCRRLKAGGPLWLMALGPCVEPLLVFASSCFLLHFIGSVMWLNAPPPPPVVPCCRCERASASLHFQDHQMEKKSQN